MQDVTIVILTKNEEKNLALCLESVKGFAKRCVIVDSGCDSGTGSSSPCLPKCGMRSKYIKKHKDLFYHIGENVMWQPRQFPADPELISIGDNVKLAANVTFVNHDILYTLYKWYGSYERV